MGSKRIGVAGLGHLGKSIAGCLLAHGFDVAVFTPAPEEFVGARDAIAKSIHELVVNSGLSPESGAAWTDRYRENSSLEGLADCDFIIESIVESRDAKSGLFDRLEEVVSPAVTIASNTSAIPISILQEGRKFPERFIGMHWAEPAHATRFMELIRGDRTSDGAVADATELALKTGKEPCVVRHDLPGFIANRIGYAMYREAFHLLESGVADAETIDTSFRNSVGLWASVCGPFRWIDMTGGPALYARAMEPVLPTLNRDTELPPALAALMARNSGGMRDGRGIYDYTPAEIEHWQETYRQNVWNVKRFVDSRFPIAPRD
jgi:3-hydroxybutyryl-CoA dehydrogenase